MTAKTAGAVYDTIGQSYTRQRRPDPRIAARLKAALADARSVLNVGAGAGSYEPWDRRVVAAEPSMVMLSQRPRGAAPAVRTVAEALPFSGQAFDAVMAVLTLHHWTDRARGLAECARVARQRVVLLTWDPMAEAFWLVQEYLPSFAEADRRQFPETSAFADAFGPDARVEVAAVPVPRDCVDGFLGAYWARPAAYLDPAVQSGISSFALAGAGEGLERLRNDLASGAWNARYAHLLEMDELDLGYRLVVADLSARAAQRGWTGAPRREVTLPSDGVITLSLFRPSDAPTLRDGDLDPEHRLRFDLPAAFIPSLEHSRDVISRWDRERVAGTRLTFAIRDVGTGELLGGCELLPLGSEAANLSYWTFPAHRLRGVATRAVSLTCQVAFEQLHFRRLEAITDPDNASSRRVASRNGFRETRWQGGRVVYTKER